MLQIRLKEYFSVKDIQIAHVIALGQTEYNSKIADISIH